MNYKMTEPCAECPFLIGSGFKFARLHEHASGEFPCHMACKVDEDTGNFVPRSDNTPHCAGALIFLEKQNRPHQMMRICERIGCYDRTKLNMEAKVGSDEADYE
jgi:hypothetical protein